MADNSTTYDLLKLELELTQQQIDKYDQVGSTIKAWTVTLWAASVGWSFQVNNRAMILVGVFVALAFWALDSVNKNFRQDYRTRRDEISKALQDHAKGEPLDIVTPAFPDHMPSGALRQFLQLHLLIFYVALAVTGIVLWYCG